MQKNVEDSSLKDIDSLCRCNSPLDSIAENEYCVYHDYRRDENEDQFDEEVELEICKNYETFEDYVENYIKHYTPEPPPDVFYFIDGAHRKIHDFDTWDELLEFIKQNQSHELYQYLTLRKPRDYNHYRITITTDQLAQISRCENALSEAPDDVYRLYCKYSWYHDFTDLFTDENISKQEEYIVYEWYTIPDNKIFYINLSQGDTTLKYAHMERKSLLLGITENYKTGFRIIASNLNYIQAEVLVRGLMLEYTDKGEYILGVLSANYRSVSEMNKTTEDPTSLTARKEYIENHTGGSKFFQDEYSERYFPELLEKNLAFDTVETQDLAIVHLLTKDIYAAVDLRILLLQSHSLMRKSVSKDCISIIVTDYITYWDYSEFKKLGKKILDSDEVEKYFTDANEIPNYGKKQRVVVPEYDAEQLTAIRAYINSHQEDINQIAQNPIDMSEFNVEKEKDKNIYERYLMVYALLNRIENHPNEIRWLPLFPFNRLLQIGAFDEIIEFYEKRPDILKDRGEKIRYLQAKMWREHELVTAAKKEAKEKRIQRQKLNETGNNETENVQLSFFQ